jgi:ligand-binding sensor domain-containing protein
MPFIARIIFLSLFVLFSSNVGIAQSYQFVNFSVEDGLPSNEVYEVIQDSKGFMWFATDRGVARYNGYKFEVFTTKNGLHNNVIFYLTEDKRQRIWFTGLGEAITYYDIVADKFVSVPYTKEVEGLMHYDIEVDEVVDDTLLIVRDRSKYYLTLSGDSLAFVKVENRLPDAFVNWYEDELSVEKDSNEAIVNYKHGNFRIKIANGSMKSKTYCLPLTDSTGIIRWYSLAFKYENGFLKVWPEFTNFYSSLNNGTSGIWVGTGLGLFKWHAKKNKFKAINQFSGKGVTSICEDHQGSVWATTRQTGVYYLKDPGIKHLIKTDGLYMDAVKDLFITEAKETPVVVATYFDNGILSFIENSKVKQVDVSSDVGSNKEIQYILPIDQDHFAVSQFGNGITLIKNGKVIQNTRFSRDVVYYNKSDQYFWRLKNQRTAFWDGHKIKLVNMKSDNAFGSPGEHMTLVRDTIYTGSVYGFGFVAKDGEWNEIELAANTKVRVNDIHANEDAVLALATMGMGVYVKQGGKQSWITEDDGLLNDICNNIYVDEIGEVWVGSNSGLSRIHLCGDNLSATNIQNFNTSSGLLSNQVNDVVRLNENEVWVATSKGISIINLAEKKTESKQVNPMYLEARSDSDPKLFQGVSLQYKENIVFNFVSLDYQKSGNIVYNYRLKGLDNTWYRSVHQSIRYSKLQDGKYEFQIKQESTGNDESVMNFPFYIETPYWKSWWFWLLGVLVISFAISARFKSVKNRSLQKVKLAEVKQQALASQMNPHFLFNSFNSIRSLIVMNQRDKAEHYLIKISDMVRGVLKNSFEKSISLENELSMISHYMEIEQIRSVKGFDYEVRVNPDVNPKEVRIPPSVLQPYIENAIIHGIRPMESGKGMIQIDCNRDALGNVNIEIQDNGVGFNVEAIRNTSVTHGSDITRQRLLLLEDLYGQKVKVEIESNISFNNSGTLVRITLGNIKSKIA